MSTAPTAFTTPTRFVRKGTGTLVLGLVVALFWPEPVPEPATGTAGAGDQPFRWGKEALFRELESGFAAEQSAGCTALRAQALDDDMSAFRALLAEVTAANVSPGDRRLSVLEEQLFTLTARHGGCSERVLAFAELVGEARRAYKALSHSWDLEDDVAAERLYRLLYGARASLEELLLALPAAEVPALLRGRDVSSAAPSTLVEGVRVHSGDLLLSRGGAPTSALIARGNDRPGNFSHVALVHVDEHGVASTIEAHIEAGVVVAPAANYLRDPKRRIMLLRMREDLPAFQQDPALAHRVAEAARQGATARHIPYDFAMDAGDPEKMFCSEVAAAAYAQHDLALWPFLTRMSSPGVVRWLGALGVEHFTTMGPSDLEYDPQLEVVAEWRDREALLEDHVDNAILDALLESADRGLALDYDGFALPLARLAKGYSLVLNLFGGVGPVPEGMSATSALRVQRLGDMHKKLHAELTAGVRDHERRRGRPPAYWTLLQMARSARDRALSTGR